MYLLPLSCLKICLQRITNIARNLKYTCHNIRVKYVQMYNMTSFFPWQLLSCIQCFTTINVLRSGASQGSFRC